MTPVCQSSSWLWHTVSSVIFNKVKLAGYYCVALTASSRANRLKDKIFWAGVIRTEIWAGKEPRPGKTWWEWEAGNWESFTQIITYLPWEWWQKGDEPPGWSYQEYLDDFSVSLHFNRQTSQKTVCIEYQEISYAWLTDWENQKKCCIGKPEMITAGRKTVYRSFKSAYNTRPSNPVLAYTDSSWEQPICWLFDMQM